MCFEGCNSPTGSDSPTTRERATPASGEPSVDITRTTPPTAEASQAQPERVEEFDAEVVDEVVTRCPNSADEAQSHINVSVQSHFFINGDESARWRNQPVKRARVELVEQGRTVTLGNWGHPGRLDVSGIPDGTYDLRVSPQESQMAQSSAGPGLSVTNGADRLYQPLDLRLQLCNQQIIGVSNRNPEDRHGSGVRRSSTRLDIDLKPVWLRSDNHGSRRGSAIEMVVVHHTGCDCGRALNTFLGNSVAPHYMIDEDGFVVKWVDDRRNAHQAGTSRWAGAGRVGERSIGIEIVHRGESPYPDAQYVALRSLLEELVNAHGIERHRIVGHEDIGTNRTGRLGRKAGDPGPGFDWQRLESSRLGLLISGHPPNPATIYDGAFANPSAEIGTRSPEATIRELQSDLAAIGYSIRVNGRYDEHTHWAVRTFRAHFEKFERARPAVGVQGRSIDFVTAAAIKSCSRW